MSSPSLPSAPSLEQLRKQAKDLLRAHRAGDPRAVARVAAHEPGEPLKLTGAQHVVAREHGFPSWARLKAYVERLAAHGPDLEHAYHEDLDYYEGRAYGLHASARDGTASAVAAFERWNAPVTEAGARTVVARRHGFASWAALRRHVAGLRDSGEPFARAYRAVEAHDVDGLRAQLETLPRPGRGGRHQRQRPASAWPARRATSASCASCSTPAPIRRAPTRTAGRRCTRPPTRISRCWRGCCWTRARRSTCPARGDGGTPLVVALFWGHREVTEVLAERGVHPRNLRAAAGLGRLDLVEELVAPDGRLAPGAGAHRAYYRPHSGFPDWRPADDPQEVLDEALAWAARSDRVDVLEPLVARGARPDADVYRGSALMWAAASGRAGAVRRLIALGADPSGRSTFGGPSHGEGVTPLHLAAQGGHLDAVRVLLDAGADPRARDANFDSTPDGWAEHGGHPAVAAAIRGA